MSLKKKIVLSFLISAFIIAILAVFEYVNFIEIRKEIRSLEIADTIRSKSLQLRRHEKNFLLYGPLSEESGAIHKYLDELDAVAGDGIATDKNGGLASLRERVNSYRRRFNKIESMVQDMSGELKKLRTAYINYKFFPFLELTFLEKPLQAAEFLESLLPSEGGLVSGLRNLDLEINALRRNGEEILAISKDLDKIARENAERTIRISQVAILVFFPLFLIVGIGALFVISSSVAMRLKKLTGVMEKTGRGNFPVVVPLEISAKNDEVDVLIQEFNNMEQQLAEREDELARKNEELLQSRKLAAIGTLASGVAHELNNPLNNIYISAQVLKREAGEGCPPIIKETVDDILSQSIRVKRIVGNLLVFARGKEPQLREVEVNRLITEAYKLLGSSVDLHRINFAPDSNPAGIFLEVDPEQMERVFINLFANAVDAMDGEGELGVKVEMEKDSVKIQVSDTGKGMPGDVIEKIFEPFYTTKDKGTGLGLAIVYNTVKRHNGEISVKSEEGRGTSFIIRLPVKRGQQ